MWATKTQYVSKSQVKCCNNCNSPIFFLKYASGNWYPTDVHLDKDEQLFVVIGSGAHYNFKPRHICNKVADKLTPSNKETEDYNQAKISLDKYNELNQDDLKGKGYPEEVIKQVINSLEAAKKDCEKTIKQYEEKYMS